MDQISSFAKNHYLKPPALERTKRMKENMHLALLIWGVLRTLESIWNSSRWVRLRLETVTWFCGDIQVLLGLLVRMGTGHRAIVIIRALLSQKKNSKAYWYWEPWAGRVTPCYTEFLVISIVFLSRIFSHLGFSITRALCGLGQILNNQHMIQ